MTCPAEFRQGRSGGSTDLVFPVRIRLRGRQYLGLLYQSCLLKPFPWGMAMWCTVVGTAS